MADGVPFYTSQERIAGGEGPTLQPQALPPSGGAGERIGNALGEFGQQATKFVLQLEHMRTQTEVSEAQVKYLKAQEELERGFAKSQDYAGGRASFDAQRQEIQRDALSGITNPGARQAAALQMEKAGIAAGKRISAHGLAVEQDVNLSGHIVIANQSQRDAINATSPEERQAAIDRVDSNRARLVASGWMSRKAAAEEKIQFDQNLNIAEGHRDLRVDPIGTARRLEDANYLPNLSAVQRETMKGQAANHADQVQMDVAKRVAETDPAAARRVALEAGMQPHNYLATLSAIDHVERQNETKLDSAAKKAADAAWHADPIVAIWKENQAFPVSDDRYLTLRNTLVEGAKRGDQQSIDRLRELDTMSAMQPYVRQAWGMGAIDLDNNIKALQHQMTAPGANVTQGQVLALKAFEAVQKEITRRRNIEPIILGGQNGSRDYALNPIDPRIALDDPSLGNELSRRNAHAAHAQSRWGGNGSVFTEEESKGFKQRWDQAGASERFDMLKLFSQALPTKAVYEGTLAEVAGKGANIAVVGRLALERPDLAREILRGMDILASDPKTHEKSALVRQALAGKVPGLLYPDPKMNDQAMDLAVALDASRRGNAGQLYDPTATSGLVKALEDVVGPLSNINRRPTPIPPAIVNGDVKGVTPSDVETAINQLTPADLASLGGAIDRNGRPISAEQLRGNMQLVPLSIGGTRYTVEMPIGEGKTKPVFDLENRPMVVDLAMLAAHHKAREAERRAALPPTPARKFRQGMEALLTEAATRPDTGAPPAPPAPAPQQQSEPAPAPAPAPPSYPNVEE